MSDAESLRAVRRDLGLSQTQFAALLETPVQTYRRWEAGRNAPPPCLWVAARCIAKHLPVAP